MKGAGREHTPLRTLDEAEEADDEYELTFSDPAEFAEAHRSFILFRSKSPTKDKESNVVEDPDEILAAPAINNRPSNGLVAPSGWDPLPSPPQAGMLTCFCILWQYSVAPPFYCIDLCSPPWQLIQLCIPNAKVNAPIELAFTTRAQAPWLSGQTNALRSRLVPVAQKVQS